MKKRYFSFIALTLVSVMLVITAGCGVRVNGKEYELFAARDKDKDNFSIVFGNESSNTQEISEGKQEGEQFIVSDNAGNITIEKSGTSQIEINADKKVKGSSEKNKETIMDNMNIQLQRNGKAIEVVIKTKDGNDFWDWQKDNFKASQITINYDISLPEGINAIEASTGAGNINVNDVKAKLTLKTGAGNIEVEDVAALKDNLLNTGAGNIDFNGNVDSITSFDASIGVGNVKFEVPEETKMSLEADTGIGLLSGSFVKSKDNNKFHFEGDINGGGPAVKLNSGVGNVNADEN
ncbi:MAG: DUF4097 family beta strand repeat-containing protein [Ruminiclostridium sp.]